MKEYAKRRLGTTFIWRWLYQVKRLLKAAVKVAIPYVPKKLLYRLLQMPFFYGRDYFDRPKDPWQESGYGDIYADNEDFHHIAELAHELFQPRRVLDVGCARGFQVGALRQRGMEAWGIDISEYAIRTAPAELRHCLSVGSCQEISFPDGHFDLVLVLETLEHVPPVDMVKAIRELRRVTEKWLCASIPSMGRNPYGHDGTAGGKIKDRYLHLYEDAGYDIDFAPFRHLIVDVNGIPIHGHLTIASFAWWTSLFNQHGFIRRGDKERVINEKLEPAGTGAFNYMVFEKASNPAGAVARTAETEWPFREVGEGIWETGPVSLPEGTHGVDLRLKVGRRPDKVEPRRRVLHAEGLSLHGAAINATRLMSEREVRRACRNGILAVPLLCSSSGPEGIRFRVSCAAGMGAEPLPISRVRYHEDLREGPGARG